MAPRIGKDVSIGVVWIVVALGLLSYGAYWSLQLDRDRARPPCPKQIPLERGLEAPPTPASLEPEGQTLEIAFWRSRAPKARKFFFGVPQQSRQALPPIHEPLNTRKRPLIREEMDGVIDVDQYVANLQVTSSRQVTLTVCVDPAAHEIDPGTYRGTVVSDDPRIENIVAPVVVTLQYPRWRWVAFWLGLLVLIAASFFVWSSSRTEVPITEEKWRGLRWTRRNAVAIGVGGIAAASAFTATYLRNPAWGASAPSDWFALMAAMFAAMTAGLTGGRASLQVRNKKGGRDDKLDETDGEQT